MPSEPTTQAGMRVLNYHRLYKTQCGVHEDEMAPIVREAEIEAATLAAIRADKAEAALEEALRRRWHHSPFDKALAKWEASK